MICLHLSLSFKSLSIPFIVNHIYCHYKYTNDERSSIIFICLQIYSHSYDIFFSLVCCCILSSFFASSLSDHTDINTRLKSHRLSTVAHYHQVSLVNRHRVLSSLEMSRVHRSLSSVRYTIDIVDTETTTPARSKIYILFEFLSHTSNSNIEIQLSPVTHTSRLA